MTHQMEVLQSLEDYLEVKGWSSMVDRENGYIHMELTLDHDLGTVPFALAATEDGAVSYALLPWDVPLERYGAVAEYLHRANYGLLNGCFELDYENGTVQYRTFAHCPEGEELTAEDMDALFSVPLAVVSHYGAGLQLVIERERINIVALMQKLEG